MLKDTLRLEYTVLPGATSLRLSAKWSFGRGTSSISRRASSPRQQEKCLGQAIRLLISALMVYNQSTANALNQATFIDLFQLDATLHNDDTSWAGHSGSNHPLDMAGKVVHVRS